MIKYVGEKRYCPLCKRYYEPAAIKRLAGQTFGHAFRAWAVYQRIILRLPYRTITQAMEELFHETASEASIVNFVEDPLRRALPAYRIDSSEALARKPVCSC